MSPHHWQTAGRKAWSQPSPWQWQEFQDILRCRIAPKTRSRLEKVCDDISLRDRMLEMVVGKMDGEERGHADFIFTAYSEAQKERTNHEPPPQSVREAVSHLRAAAVALGAKPLSPDLYEPRLDPAILKGYPAWLRAYPWLSDYVLYLRSQSELPIQFLLFAGIAMLLVSLGSSVRVQLWGKENTVNLYILFIGVAGKVRKSHAIDLGREMLTRALPHIWHVDGISAEKMEGRLRERPSGLVVQDEFHRLLIGQGFKEDLRGMILSLHNKSVYATSYIKRGDTNILHPAVSIVGAMTTQGFWDLVDKGLFSGGLFSRFIPVWSDYVGERLSRLAQEEIEDTGYVLRRHLELLGTDKDAVLMLAPEDAEALDAWEKSIEKDAMIFGNASVAARLATNTFRVAVALWASRERPTNRTYIPKDCLEAAKQLMTTVYLTAQEQLELGLAKTPEGRQMLTILNLLRENGGKMTYHDIAKEMEILDNKLDRLLVTLERRKEITLQTDTVDGMVGSEEIQWVRLREGE